MGLTTFFHNGVSITFFSCILELAVLDKCVHLQIRTNGRNFDPDALFTVMSRGEGFVFF